jgi:protein gp37
MGNPSYEKGFNVEMHENILNYPLEWKKPRKIFVNSMSDLFHESIPDEFIFRVFDIMHEAKNHRFQILTKRSARLKALNPRIRWSENIWMGVSVENKDYEWRIDDLRSIDAHLKFLSLEPLLGSLQGINLDNIDWVIVGGESGPGARPVKKEWVIQLRDQCNSLSVPFFFKQWGGVNKKKTGRVLEGITWDQMPDIL